MEFLPVPLHFTSTFIVTVAAAAAMWVAFARRDFAPAKRAPHLAFIGGWALVGLGEMIHGAQIVTEELDQVLLALRTGGYALLVLALIGTRRRGGTEAGQAVTAGANLALMPTFLAAVAALFAYRNRLRGARLLALSLGMFAISELLFGLGGAGDPSAVWYLAHGVRLGAGLSVGVWLREGIKTSIRVRFVTLILILMLVVIVAISSVMTQIFAANVREDALERARTEGELQQRTLGEREREAIQRARTLAESPGIGQSMAERSPGLVATASAVQRPGGLFDGFDFLAFLDSRGAILGFSAAGRDGEPVLDDADALGLVGTAVAQSALEGVEAASIDLIGTRNLGVVAAYTVMAPRGTEAPGAPAVRAGAVVLGNLIDRGYLMTLPGVDEADDSREISVVGTDGVLATTFDNSTGLIDLAPDLSRQVLEGRGVLVREGEVGPDQYFNSFVPLERRDNDVIAALVISLRSEVLDLTQRGVGRTLFLVALVAAAVALGLSSVSGARITEPIRTLTQAARRIQEGDLETRVSKTTEDEVGTLGEAFNEMTGSLSRLTGELREAAQEEFRLRSQLETVLQSMSDGVIAVDGLGKVVVMNREAERITGRSLSRARGSEISKVLQIRDDANGSKIDLPLYDRRQGAARGVVSNSSGSSRVPVAVTSAPIRSDEGEVIGAVGVVRDLTREIEIEKMKTEFLSNISHELRTPLTPIKGYAGMLRRKGLPRRSIVGFADSIEKSTIRLERIVDMLVDVAAMQAGRLSPTRTWFDLDAATADLVGRRQALAPKHRFERRGFRRLREIEADERLLPRAIDELIDNAVKFSPKGGKVTLRADIGSSERGRGTVRLSVVDRGVGIPPERLDEITEDFIQVDASGTREFGGLGLGLAYVRRIVDAHRGSLEIDSTQGEGSTFTIVLPKAVRATNGKPLRKPKATKPKATKPKATKTRAVRKKPPKSKKTAAKRRGAKR